VKLHPALVIRFYAVNHIDQAQYLHIQSGLFHDFPARRLENTFSQMLCTTGQAPLTLIGRLATAHQQKPVFPPYNDTHPDDRPVRVFARIRI
jgi:hypothetical protein